MENRRGMMRIFLFENLRDLMLKNIFEKITIKQICDETGVIRATFYNYFDDKYDCLNAIVHQDLVVNTKECRDQQDIIGMLRIMFETIEDNSDFYQLGYNVIGQNSFEDNRNDAYLPIYSNDILSQYYAECLAFDIKTFVFHRNPPLSVDAMVTMTVDLMKNSFTDFVE